MVTFQNCVRTRPDDPEPAASLSPELAQSSGLNALARSGYFGVHLVGKVARAVWRINSIELGGEQPNLSAERIVLLGAKWGKQMGLRRPKAVIEAGEELVSLFGGDDSTGAPVGRIRSPLN